MVTRQAGEYGYVALRLSGTRTGELLDAVAARCERLVSETTTAPAERVRQRRLIALALAAPFMITPLVAVIFPPIIGSYQVLLALAAIFAIGFLAAAVVSLTGRAGFGAACLLLLGTMALAPVIAATGGAASPTALVLLALVFESWWVGRSRFSVACGVGASLAALSLQSILGAEPAFAAATSSPADWLVPVGYLAVVIPRAAVWLEEYASPSEAAHPALEEIIDAVIMRMDLTGEVVDASPQARRILGLAPELLLSNGLFDRLHVADRVAYLCALADLKEGEGVRHVDVRARVPGTKGSSAGDYRPFSLEMTRTGTDEKVLTLLLRVKDASTSTAGPQTEPNEAVERIELANSRMLAAVSHELRTPLNSIIGFSEMLLNDMAGTVSNPRQREYLGLVRDSGNHLLCVVNSMLDFSQLESGVYSSNPESFCFADAVDLCRSMLSRQAEAKTLNIVTDMAAGIGEIRADKRAVKQILINLLSNAIKFTPAGGTVAVGAKRLGSQLHFWVSDTGIGIPAEDIGRLGEPFVQVRNDYTRVTEGTGLGLSLVKGLVSLHKGTMSIESEQGHGTTVTVCLPVNALPAPEALEMSGIRPTVSKPYEEAYHDANRKTA